MLIILCFILQSWSCRATSETATTDLNCAQVLFDRIKDADERADTLINLAKFNYANNRVENADRQVFEALNITEALKRDTIKHTSLSVAGNIYRVSRIGNPQHLRRAAEIAKKIEFVEDRVWAYRELVAGFGRLGLTEEANALFQEALKTIPTIREQKELDVDGEELEKSQLLQSGVVAGFIDQSLKIAQGFKNPHRRDEVLGSVAVKLAELGRFPESLKITKRMYSGQLPRTLRFAHQKINTLIEIANIARDAGDRSNSKVAALDALFESNRTTEEEKPRHLVDVAVSLMNIGEKERALAILKQAEASAKLIGNPSFQYPSYSYVAVGYARLGQYDKAMDLTRLDKSSTNGLIGIAKYLLDDGQKAKALEVLSQAVEVGNKISCSYDKYEEKVRACSSEKAIHLVEILGDSDKIKSFDFRVPSSPQWETPIENITKAFAGDRIKAKYDDYGYSIGTPELIEAYAFVGRYENALEMAKKVTSPEEKILGIAIIEGYYKDADASVASKIAGLLPCREH